MDDYYSGADGARRFMSELDGFLQVLVNNVEPTEQLTCEIELQCKGGELVLLNKTYRPARTSSGDVEPD
jgi:hypothetical protein